MFITDLFESPNPSASTEQSRLLDKPTKTPAQLAKKHGKSIAIVQAQLKRGIEVEKEHTSDVSVAREIALDHLGEDIYYYKRLAKVEKVDEDDMFAAPKVTARKLAALMQAGKEIWVKDSRDDVWKIHEIIPAEPGKKWMARWEHGMFPVGDDEYKLDILEPDESAYMLRPVHRFAESEDDMFATKKKSNLSHVSTHNLVALLQALSDEEYGAYKGKATLIKLELKRRGVPLPDDVAALDESDDDMFAAGPSALVRAKHLLDKSKSVYIEHPYYDEVLPVFSIYIDENTPRRYSDSVTVLLKNWRHLEHEVNADEWALAPFANGFVLKKKATDTVDESDDMFAPRHETKSYLLQYVKAPIIGYATIVSQDNLDRNWDWEDEFDIEDGNPNNMPYWERKFYNMAGQKVPVVAVTNNDNTLIVLLATGRPFSAPADWFQNINLQETDLTEGATSILYHYTSPRPALRILQSGEFELTSSVGSPVEGKIAPKGYPYYMSTTRSKVGDYHARIPGSHAVMFVLDGVKLAHNYKVKPIDYWEGMWQRDNSNERTRESEDRVFSKTPSIPIGGIIKEIHQLVTDHDEFRSPVIRQLAILAKTQGIPIYFYTDTKSWILQAPKGRVSVSKIAASFKGPMKKSMSLRHGRISPLQQWIELIFKKNKEELSQEANQLRFNMVHYGARYPNEDQGLSTELANARKPGDPEKVMGDKVIQYMRQNKLANTVDLKNAMIAKWS